MRPFQAGWRPAPAATFSNPKAKPSWSPPSRPWGRTALISRPLSPKCCSRRALHDRKKSRLESFTLRELEVAQLIAEGSSNKQIARQLEISIKTVESHRAAAMRKAGVRTAAEFVRFAIKHHLIQA